MRNRSMVYCLGWLAFAPAARAGGDWIILGGDNTFWTSNPDLPVCKQLTELQKTSKFQSVAVSRDGDGFILTGGNALGIGNRKLDVSKKLLEFQKKGYVFNGLAFHPDGGWMIFFGRDGLWFSGGLPEPACKKVDEVGRDGGTPRSIAFAPGGGWVLLYDKTGVAHTGIPDDLARLLDGAVAKGVAVRCVAFTTTGNWFCLTDDGPYAGDPSHPAFKQLQELVKDGASPKWIAFTPEDPATMRYVLDARPTRRVRAVLTSDIAHPDAKVEEWIVLAPEAPSLPSQRDVKTTFTPPGQVVEELSPLKRRMIVNRITDGRKEFRGVLTIDATLVSRRLRPLRAGEAGPKVPDLSPEEVKNFTRATPSVDMDSAGFRGWMAAGNLKRKADETDMAYAHRAFAYVKHHFTYVYPTPPDDDSASKICKAGRSDCGGLSSVFVALMRANGVPARMLIGRWAASEEKDDRKYHVKAEFFARGVGWVPVDSAAAVGDTKGRDFEWFGNDAGDHISFTNDGDLLVDTYLFGKPNIGYLQGITHWWAGSGDDKNFRETDRWAVRDLKTPGKD
jgi:transglutaminase-like putative cysteine protease